MLGTTNRSREKAIKIMKNPILRWIGRVYDFRAKAQTTPLENDICLNHCLDVVKETIPLDQPTMTETEEIKEPVTIKEEGKDV